MCRIKSRLLRLFKRRPEVEAAPSGLERRTSRVVERILENESLTADLDDAAAQALLDWGIACSKRVAQSTAGLNDEAAEEAMVPRLRATRQLMRSVSRWVVERGAMDAESTAASLAEIIERAATIYGQDLSLPGDDQRDDFLRQIAGLGDAPQQMIARLRELVERSSG